MAESQFFPQFLPKQTRFVTAENPSPVKFSGSFSQLEGAFSILESFLGNGVDFHVTADENRKLLFNVSSAIGRTDKLYKPINCAPSLEFISNVWGVELTHYDRVNDTLRFLSGGMSITVPVTANSDFEFGIYYKGRGRVLNTDGLVGENDWITLPDTNGEFKWLTLPITADVIHFIKINMPMDAAVDSVPPGPGLIIKALYVMNPLTYNGVYNKAYCVPLENNSYWTLKTPCKYSAPGIPNECGVKTCNYCIGQTYDFVTGEPKCVSLDEDSTIGAYYSVQQSYVPIHYTPEVTLPRRDYLTIQSPLLTKHNNYALMYKPFHMHSDDVDSQISPNQCTIYDTQNSSATIKYLTALYSAGGISGKIRGDIFYVKDKTEITAGEGNPKRYMVIGGNYGFLDLIYNVMGFINLPQPLDATEHVAVYDK